MALTIEQIRALHEKMPRQEVSVPALGDTVFVRKLRLREVRELQEMGADATKKPVDTMIRIVECAACNADGTPLFEGADTALVPGLPVDALEVISDAAMVFSGLKKTGDSSEPDAEEEAKNA